MQVHVGKVGSPTGVVGVDHPSYGGRRAAIEARKRGGSNARASNQVQRAIRPPAAGEPARPLSRKQLFGSQPGAFASAEAYSCGALARLRDHRHAIGRLLGRNSSRKVQDEHRTRVVASQRMTPNPSIEGDVHKRASPTCGRPSCQTLDRRNTIRIDLERPEQPEGVCGHQTGRSQP